MIPSLLNLMIAGASFLRGVPGLSRLLLGFMPAGKATATFDRTWIALVLTGQVFVGGASGNCSAGIFGDRRDLLFFALHWLRLLDTARDVAAFDLPGKVLSLLWGGS
jgi:hypothetical protein